MRVVVAGATGFIGRALCRELIGSGYHVVGLSRSADRARKVLPKKITVVQWDGETARGWADHADGALAVVNLAGENIASGRWTRERKALILTSRLHAARAMVNTVACVHHKPKVLLQASGIGYYGFSSDEARDEVSPPGEGFLADVAKQWEYVTKKVEGLGVRRVLLRTGIVLGVNGGVLPRLVLPFRLFAGGPLGSGRQWLSWIHLIDEVKAIRFLMEAPDLKGAFNLTAPQPLTNKDFCRLLGKALRRPSWLPVPGFAVRLLLGEMAKETALSGQRVLPKRLLDSGYRFRYENAESALKDIFTEGNKREIRG